MSAQEIGELMIPACSMVIAALSLIGVFLERRAKETRNEAILSSKIDNWGEMMADINTKLTTLLEGYNSNEKRITLLEDRYKVISGRVNDLEKHRWKTGA